MSASEPLTVEDWLLADVTAAVQSFAQDLAEEIAADYDEVICDRDQMTQHFIKGRVLGLRGQALRFDDKVWDSAREVLAARGLPDVVVDLILETADELPERVAEGLDIDMAAVAAIHGSDVAGEAARDYVRTEAAAIARAGW